jgi:hypothetical protein
VRVQRVGAGPASPGSKEQASLRGVSESAPTVISSDDLLRRAREVIAAAAHDRLPMRLLGGIAVYALAKSARRAPLARSYRDFDVAVPAKQGAAASRVLEMAGLVPDRHFNALHGARRLIFQASEGYPVDVLVGDFVMCHSLQFEDESFRHELTISPADLLLTKLQIVRIEPKDLADVAALLLDVPLDANGIDPSRFVAPLRADWGFFHTVELNLPKVTAFARANLQADLAERLAGRVGVLARAMESAPKSLAWRLRARVGERMTWYEMPEELD